MACAATHFSGKLLGMEAMPMFKICLKSKKKRVLVRGDTVDDVKNAAAMKLGVEEPGAIVLEEDGTEVDEDEILLELAACSVGPCRLILLSTGEEWENHADTVYLDSSLDIPVINVTPLAGIPPPRTPSSASPPTTPTTPMADTPSRARLLCIPWAAFPCTFLEDCAAGKEPTIADRRTIVETVGKYIVWDLKETGSHTQQSAVRQLAARFPTLCDRIANQRFPKDFKTLTLQIKNKVSYEKSLKRRKLGQAGTATETLRTGNERRKTQKDSYGCVAEAWEPSEYPPGESADSQEEKRVWLSGQPSTTEEVLAAMAATHIAQRLQINGGKKKSTKDVIAAWPHLGHHMALTAHFSTLIGEDMREKWATALANKTEPMVKFFSATSGKKKTLIASTLASMSAAVIVRECDLPKSEALIPLLTDYFEETGIIRIFEVGVQEADILLAATTPLLGVIGTSIHGADATFLLIVDGVLLGRPATLLDGLLSLFAAHYVLNLAYAVSCSSTMEFIQRIFFEINPERGDKRGAKKKKVTIDPKVAKLAAALSASHNLFSVNT